MVVLAEVLRIGEDCLKVNNVEEFDPDPFLAELAKDGLPWNETFNQDLEV